MVLDPIAIVGIGCRFPGAANPDAFWELLKNGRDAIREVPASRWQVEEFYHPDPATPDKTNTRWGGFLEAIDQFDPHFFGIAPREALTIDPQQRLILEVGWEALEDAGQIPDQLAGTQTGVFVGISTHDYSVLLWRHPMNEPHATTGTGNCIAANRLSYSLDLRGPSVAVDTACSSSLVAVHLACQSLWQGESTLALAAGVNVLLLPTAMVGFTKSGFMAADGRCKTFDASADGYVRGEGVGVVVLKPLAQAEADGDRIYAVIRGSAVNQDGRSNGLTAPNPQAQAQVLRQAYDRAGISPAEISYIEAHGTGTKLGDPMEWKTLGQVLSENRSPESTCAIGSVKTNIGHLEAAAGIAGLIKVALALHHRQLPPSLHFHNPNPYLDLKTTPLQVQTQLEPWHSHELALAGVSSFGFGGTNAHVVLQAVAPADEEQSNGNGSDRPIHLLTLTAKTDEALRQLASHYQQKLTELTELADDVVLADICFTANTRRSRFSQRLAVLASSSEQMQQRLAIAAQGQLGDGIERGVAARKPPRVAFLFPGQGSQYLTMGRELYDTQPIFRAAIDRCDAILKENKRSLRDLLYPGDPAGNGRSGWALDQTANAQIALFAVEYALAEVWQTWGVQPSAVMGHSLGEYVAACVAGVFSLEDGLKLVAARGQLMQQLPAGAMVAVVADAATVQPFLAGTTVAIAALNSPENTVVSGSVAAIDRLSSQLHDAGLKTIPLAVSRAFHSSLMEPMLAEFAEVAATIAYHPPRLTLVCNVTGRDVGAEIATPDYWCRHARQPVQFAAGMATLEQQGCQIMLEVGAKPTLIGMGRQCLPSQAEWLFSLHPQQSNWQSMLHSLASLFVRGVAIDWVEFDRHYSRQRISLPTYPFQRQRFWWAGAELRTPIASGVDRPRLHPLLGERIQLAGTQEIRFQAELSATPAYLRDHQIFAEPIVPAAALIEVALMAGSIALNSSSLRLEQYAIEQPLRLDETTCIQTVLVPDGTCYIVKLFSFTLGSDRSCILHAVGKISREDGAIPVKTIQQGRSDYSLVAIKDFYQTLRTSGFAYGSSFQAVKQLWQGEAEATGAVQLPAELALEASHYGLHPVLLDAGLQVLAAAVPGERPYMPVGFDRLIWHRSPATALWSYVTVVEQSTSFLKATVQLVDEAGQTVADITGLLLQAATQQSVTMQGRSLYERHWITKPLTAPRVESRHWLIVADHTVGATLAHSLQEAGDRCTVISLTGNDTPAATSIDPHRQNPYQPVLQTIAAAPFPLTDVVYLAGVADVDPAGNGMATVETGCDRVLSLVQALAWSGLSPRLWLVTRGTQAIAGTAVQVRDACLWGLAGTIRAEYPALQCTCLDLDPLSGDGGLLQALQCPDAETQIAYRQGTRYVARLHSLPTTLTHPASPFRVITTQPGTLDALTLSPASRRPPQANEVEIQVCTVGLNFRDVLTALNLLPTPLATAPTEIGFGGECAGRIVAIGAGVTRFTVGDEVIAAQAIGCLGSHVTVIADRVVPKPSTLTWVEAATITTAFLTALYGLHHLAQIKPGDRVLIHAAAGGVGQAAVQLAQQVGAEVFATASPGKWDALRSMGVVHLYNSRTLEFAEAIMRHTQGRGVDVVLNSLSGDFIAKSLAVLAPSGRLIELGKRGIWTTQQVEELRPDVFYAAFDLLEMAQTPRVIADLLAELMPEFEQGLRPLPHQVFPVKEVAIAYRFMAQAKHIGKVVITLPQPAPSLRPDASYWITGGLGGLGLEVAREFVEHGATHLVLIGRGQATATAEAAIACLEHQGATIHVVQADISEAATVEQLMAAPAAIAPPLRGIVHAAGVARDGMLDHLTWGDFQAVMAAKVVGTWNLHQATRSLPLDFFVCFSSAVAVLDTPGQGNYAAANAGMDAIVSHRRSLGLPGTTIHWGLWEIGMGASLDSQQHQRLMRSGINPIAPASGAALFTQLLALDRPQVAVLPIDWQQFAQHSPPSPLLEAVLPQPSPAQERGQLPVKSFDRAQLLNQIRLEVARVLGAPAEQIPLHQPLTELGMDSLTTVEFKNRLQTILDAPISLSLVLNCSTIEALAEGLIQELALAIEGIEPTPTIASVSVSGSPNGNNHAGEFTSVDAEIPLEHYQFDRSPEYLDLRRSLQEIAPINPFFKVHTGVANHLISIDGQALINYANYNYLGMAGEPIVSQAAQAAIDQYGTSVSASRVVAGEIPLHRQLEGAIAELIGTEDCIVYVGGHSTNETTIGHLFGKNDLILYDALSHNSIRQGCSLSGATAIEFSHNDPVALAQRLHQHRHHYEKVLIVIEGIYSTDGDLAPLPAIVDLKKRYKTYLMVDEAHSIGVLGAGRGIAAEFGVPAQAVDLWMGTLSKSFASCGGYVAGSKALIEYLKYTAPGFVFSVGMSPPNTAAALAAIRLVQAQPDRVAQLHDRARLLLTLAQQAGLNTGVSRASPIIPVIVGESQQALQLSQRLFDRGIHVQPMVYPSVAYNAARLRFFVTCLHTEAQIHFTVETLADELHHLLPITGSES